MFGNEAVLLVVFEFQRMVVAVVDADQPAEAIVAVVDLDTVGQGFDQQPPGRVPLVTGFQLRAVSAELGFLQQLTLEVVGVRGALAVEAGFLTDQAAGGVVQPIFFAGFVFDFRE
ncbi:hypothetical protein D3C85_1554440 [compost metagenome]